MKAPYPYNSRANDKWQEMHDSSIKWIKVLTLLLLHGLLHNYALHVNS